MMRAFAPSDANASDATTTSDSGSQSKNSRGYIKLILCCFLSDSCPHIKIHPNRTKNIEANTIGYRSALVGWSGQPRNSCIHFKLIIFGF